MGNPYSKDHRAPGASVQFRTMWHPDGDKSHEEAAKCTKLRHQDSSAELHSRLLHTASSLTVDRVRESSSVPHASANLGQGGLGGGSITME